MSAALQLILEIEADFDRLRREYIMFLNDQVKVEPYNLKESLTMKVRRLRNMGNLRTEEQFRTNNLVTKVQSHLGLWERQLNNKYMGRGPQRPKKTPKPASQAQEPQNKRVVISNAASQRDAVVELYDEYTRMNLLAGNRKIINFAKFQKFINAQTQKIQTAKRVEKVRYEIAMQDQKVVIKSKSIRDKS